MSALEGALHSYAAGLATALSASVLRAGRGCAPLAARLAAAGIGQGDLTPEGVVAGLGRLPVLSKDEVMAAQHADPPFGGLLAEGASLRRVYQSPGPIYEPQLDGADPWRWAPALRACGMGQDDLVLNCFGYHLSPAGAMFDEGALAVGARVLPGGIGNQDLQARAVADLGVTAYTGLPSYLKAVIDRYAELGLPWERWRLAMAMVTAEPLPDSLRATLRERVPTVLMAYGTAEAGLIGYETEPGGGLVPGDGLLVQVCDLTTGEPLVEGEGQVVVTLLRTDYPLVRFGTGDLSAWQLGPDGRPRLAGVLGRVGAAIKVRGMFLHPRQAAAALDGTPGLAAWRLIVDRVDHRDELTCKVVPAEGVDHEELAATVGQRIRSGLRFGSTVEVVDALEGVDGPASPLLDRRSWD